MAFLNVDGSSLFYTVIGEGTPIVFIHPPVLTSANFKYQIEGLSQNFQVITFDIRGHGKSHFSSKPITYQLIVEDIKKLLDHLEIDKAIICGYSTGGSVALEFFLTFPNQASGGIVISGMPDVYDEYLRKKITIGIKLAKAGAKSFLACSFSLSNSNTKDIFKKMFTEARQGDIKNIEQYLSYSLQFDCSHQLGKIDHPILLVYGIKDKTFHHYAKLLHEKLPNNELKFINENHRIPTKAANELNELIKNFVQLHE